jgi:hypothetical protein
LNIYLSKPVIIFQMCLSEKHNVIGGFHNWHDNISITNLGQNLWQHMDRPGTCIILDKKYNIANSSCHFGSYGSIWTGPSPKKYYMDLRSFGLYNIFLMTDRSMYCHMTRSDVNYLLFNTPFFFNDKNIFHQIFFAIICIIAIWPEVTWTICYIILFI